MSFVVGVLMKIRRASKESVREAILNSIKGIALPVINANPDDCYWPSKCECIDCKNYHPFFSPLIVEDKR